MSKITFEYGQVVTCAETGNVFTIEREGNTANVAISHDGQFLSNEGVARRELQAIKQREPIWLYVSGDSRLITSWKGWPYGRCFLSKRKDGNYNVYAVDVFGGSWFGVGCGANMAIRIRPVRRRRYFGDASPGSFKLAATPFGWKHFNLTPTLLAPVDLEGRNA